MVDGLTHADLYERVEEAGGVSEFLGRVWFATTIDYVIMKHCFHCPIKLRTPWVVVYPSKTMLSKFLFVRGHVYSYPWHSNLCIV